MAETLKVKADTTKIVQEEKYPLEDLIENCEALTGHKKEVGVGALFNFKKQEITKTEFQDAIKNFLRKKVE